MSKTDNEIKKALKNIEDDRKITKELLDDAIKYVAVDEARHREVGIIMSKFGSHSVSDMLKSPSTRKRQTHQR